MDYEKGYGHLHAKVTEFSRCPRVQAGPWALSPCGLSTGCPYVWKGLSTALLTLFPPRKKPKSLESF